MGESISNLMIDLLELHFAEYQQTLIQLLWVEDGHILLDESLLFQFVQTYSQCRIRFYHQALTVLGLLGKPIREKV